MIVDLETLDSGQIYHLMIQTLIPRPIAWVMSENPQGSTNLAPFSYFNGVSSTPPLVMISIGYKKNGERKDTWKNIEAQKHFIINIPSAEHAQLVSDSAFEFEYDESEIAALNISTAKVFKQTHLEMVQSAKIAFHCTWYETKLLGPNEQGLIFAEIKEIYIDDSISHQQRRRLIVDAEKLDPLARLGGSDFGKLGSSFTIPRAKVKPSPT